MRACVLEMQAQPLPICLWQPRDPALTLHVEFIEESLWTSTFTEPKCKISVLQKRADRIECEVWPQVPPSWISSPSISRDVSGRRKVVRLGGAGSSFHMVFPEPSDHDVSRAN